jgi:hypothetical protein
LVSLEKWLTLRDAQAQMEAQAQATTAAAFAQQHNGGAVPDQVGS